MPELPEVETQVRDLQFLIGRKILEVSSNTKKAFTPRFSEFKKRIENKKILAIERRAKYIIFTLTSKLTHHLSGGLTSARKTQKLLIHFRMTGHFLISKNSIPLEKSVRHFFKLSGGTWLQFSDIRKFGTLRLVSERDFQNLPEIRKLGAEPLSKNFTFTKFREIIQPKTGKLKSALLDQKIIAGIGNIYADEICFAAGLHPASQIEKLNPCDIEKLFCEIRNQLRKGIRNRGTTIGEFVDVRGKIGKNQNSLAAYRRHGKECKICGTILRKMKISQRTTSFCPKCQIRK
ncbi:bifunctional DNA-formamidopyrimidine glycosylase/DNA-(apurinic or apyrimidinic site) lyase [Patescibacteria group bacterium]|nr:bifunctional DNA-formamidopyrimidine glycosylase/DNA-(apurinic or apyrimidinic site) lyase [Patescibacteria group bacterium]